MNSENKNVIIAGGGSGGHIFPALSIADALVKSGIDIDRISFFGSKYTLEKTIVPKSGYKIFLFPGRGVNKIKSVKNLFKNIINTIGLVVAIFKSLFLMIKIKPVVVIGVGGFASFPAIISATILRKKIVIHEQNSVLGRINTIAQKLGATVITTFKNTEGINQNAINLGLPLRSEVIEKINNKNIEKDNSTNSSDILIFGGSLGARCINTAVIEMLQNHKIPKDWKITLFTGETNFENVYKAIGGKELDISISAFTNKLFELMLKSDVIVSRAGAGTCVEIEISNAQCILIPLQIAPGDHQSKNANSLILSGKGLILKESALNGETLFKAIEERITNNRDRGEINTNSIHLSANLNIAKNLINNNL